jgi:hypothetical protein
MRRVAILGAGSVGTSLGVRLAAAGASVVYGVREPAGREALPGSGALPLDRATADAEVIILAVPAGAAGAALRSAGGPERAVVVDCTNPLRWDAGPVWDPPAEGSVTAQLAAAFPGIRVVKGFNHFGAEVMRNPARDVGGDGAPQPAPAFFAGDDAGAKKTAMALADAIGFTPRDAGPLRNAAVLENLAVLWIHLATVAGVGRSFAFDMALEDPGG